MLNSIIESSFCNVIVRHALTNITIVFPTWQPTLVSTVLFGIHDTYNGSKLSNSNFAAHQKLAASIHHYLDGKKVDFSSIELDLDGLTVFQKRVLSAARSIPRGTTVSYSQLAELAGEPRAVRATASVMARNRFPILIPCHRVIRSDGGIGGFMGKLDGREVALKKRLLEFEHIV